MSEPTFSEWKAHPIVLEFRTDGGALVVRIHQDGRVELGEGFTADEASREFWRIVERNFPFRTSPEAS